MMGADEPAACKIPGVHKDMVSQLNPARELPWTPSLPPGPKSPARGCPASCTFHRFCLLTVLALCVTGWEVPLRTARIRANNGAVMPQRTLPIRARSPSPPRYSFFFLLSTYSFFRPHLALACFRDCLIQAHASPLQQQALPWIQKTSRAGISRRGPATQCTAPGLHQHQPHHGSFSTASHPDLLTCLLPRQLVARSERSS